MHKIRAPELFFFLQVEVTVCDRCVTELSAQLWQWHRCCRALTLRPFHRIISLILLFFFSEELKLASQQSQHLEEARTFTSLFFILYHIRGFRGGYKTMLCLIYWCWHSKDLLPAAPLTLKAQTGLASILMHLCLCVCVCFSAHWGPQQSTTRHEDQVTHRENFYLLVLF